MNRRRFIFNSIFASVGIVLSQKLLKEEQSFSKEIGGTFAITTFSSELNYPYVFTTEPIRFDATEKEVQKAVDKAYDKIIENNALLFQKNDVR